MKKSTTCLTGLVITLLFNQAVCRAWDYEGHRFVNQLALASLPTNFPAFVKTPEARERIAFLAGEPDRWRNTADLNHFNAPDHYFDLEDLALYGIDEHSLTHFRYDFTAQLALARAAQPDKFPPIDPEQNRDHTRQLIGFLPWAIMENYDKLKSQFSYLKAFEKYGTPDEIANAKQNIIYIMGVTGHYVGDTAQPLHTTKHFNGWAGENPDGYTREKIHGHVDGYFRDPEGNRLEVFCDTQWYIEQPCIEDLDLSQPAEQIRAKSDAFWKSSVPLALPKPSLSLIRA